ncbi:Splicing factor 3B subunit 2 [Cytospora mali]|uniref:Splicing factor 3B subunit 2 n=1 Tax=Cytospora mali TaxID=578113 RepID=A0A194V7F4_CYTMA|nr:Splicing factor 3B subunit 2 [Valsa mali var. pyri (nom. inval.)]
MAAPKMSKNQMRRAKKKEQKKAQAETPADPIESVDAQENGEKETNDVEPAVKAEELEVKKDPDAKENAPPDGPIDLAVEDEDPTYADYKRIFERFGPDPDETDVQREANAGNKGTVFFENDDIPFEEEQDGQPKLSKKKRKKMNKLSIAELKALVRNPEVVEWQDPSSSDPRLLVQIKAQRNVVPVPGHWSLKREYLSSKRGIEKPPFKLPKFIADTGITEMRDAVLEKQAEQSLKQKQRERVQPKMGKLDIDYQKLYDAFFRFQMKPDLTRFGDLYHEGKEWEADYRYFKPGEVSDSLRDALGMQPGFPPPWLLQQQRVGPPPSYPLLKIPGLNAPLPAGASWGFGPGQWGKPPVDEYNRPIYGGDIFGVTAGNPAAPTQLQAAQPQAEPVDRTLWGELKPPEESEEEESEEEEEDEDEEEEDADIPGGLETPGGLVSSVPTDYGHAPSGVETSMAGEFDLRKQRRGYETEESVAGPRSAYQVIPERQTRAEGFFGSDRVYDLSKNKSGVPVLGQEDESRKRKKPGDVDVALDPEALASHDGISKDELRRKFDEGRKEDGVGKQWQYDDDLSEMIAQESRKRIKRDEEKRGGGDKKKETKYRF